MDVPPDPFKFSLLIGVVFAAIVIGGLSVVHWYEPDTVTTQTSR